MSTGLCAEDVDCTDNADVCMGGQFGCSSVSVCTGMTVNPGTSFVCASR